MSVNKQAIDTIITRMKDRKAAYDRDTDADYAELFQHVSEFNTYKELYAFARKVSPTYERFCLSMGIIAPMFWKRVDSK
jgi:hypothetical protein